MKTLCFFFLFSLALFCLTAKGQETVELLTFHGSTETLQASSEKGLILAVKVENEYLKNVSSSLLKAETWVRTHVLAHYPAKNVSTILLGETILCNKDDKNILGLILHSIKNIHYSLTRWGLQNDIKVSASFSSDCLDSKSEAYRVDFVETYIKPLLHTLQELGSPYVVSIPSQHLPTLSDDETTLNLLKSHLTSMKNLGFFHLNKISMMIDASSRRVNTFTARKLSFFYYSKIIDPFPPRPNPTPTPTPTPLAHAPSGHSSPAYAAKSPLPPLVGTIIPPPNSFPFAPSVSPEVNPTSPPFLPSLSPMVNPATPPFGPHLPPCNPSEGGGVGAPIGGGIVHDAVWCVAKPSVPQETLQEALDYACGEGGADCEAIGPHGSCYFPDSLVAHASYAFNSYWQKTKKSGGTCGFGGTAMLINSDPSYRHCRFVLA